MDEDRSRPDVLAPQLLAAHLALGRIEGRLAESVPMTAAWWLVDGYEGVELVKLAGLTGDNTPEVREAIQEVLDEMGIDLPSGPDAVKAVFDDLAHRCLDGRMSERSVAAEVWRIYVDSDYSETTLEEPLGRTVGFDDEWEGGWGRLENELVIAVGSACREQLGSA